MRKQLLSALLLLFAGWGFGQTYYEQDFNSGFPNNWSIVDGGNTPRTWSHITDNNGSSFDGTEFVHVDSDSSGNDTLNEQLISPSINTSSADNLILTFEHYFDRIASEVGYIDVYDGVQWVQIASYNSSKGSYITSAQAEIDIDAQKNANMKVRFRYEDKGSWGIHWSVDNIRIKNKQCFDPTNLNVAQTNSNSAYVTWDSKSNGASWQVRFGPTGFVPGAGDTVTTSNDTVAIGPLNPDTDYDFYVRELCVNGKKSSWVGPETFHTRCQTQQIPFKEDMESFTVSYDALGYVCWVPDPTNTFGEFRWNTEDANTSSSGTGPTGDHTPYSSSGVYAYTESSSGSQGDEAHLTSSKIDLSGAKNPILTFWYHMYGFDMGSLKVEVSNDGGKTWNNVTTISGEQHSSSNDPWSQHYTSLGQYSGQAILLRFTGVRGTGLQSDMAIDDIKIQKSPLRDLSADTFRSPTDPDCFGPNHPVRFPIVNGGQDSLDLSQDSVTLTVEVSGTISQTLTTTLTNNSLNGGDPLGTLDTIEVPMGNVDMSTNGTYEFKGYISSISGDTVSFNDTISKSYNVASLSGGMVNGGGTLCKGDSITLSATGQTGSFEWQTNDGSGWNTVSTGTPSPGELKVGPTTDTRYRVEVCSSATSSVDTVNINAPSPPSVQNDTFCKGIDGVAELQAYGNGKFFWFEEADSDQLYDTGKTTNVPVNYSDKTYWVSRSDSGITDPVLITEVDNGSWSDGVEIQNVSQKTVDVNGWSIIMNEGLPINDQDDSHTYTSGTGLASGDKIRIGEINSSINLSWTSTSNGWVVLMNDQDQVVDMMFFGYTQADISNFNPTINGTNVTTTGEWSGAGVSSGCDGFNGNATARNGDRDNDDASDWGCVTETMGSDNPNIDLPFGGCRSDRVAVTAFAENCSGIEAFDQDRSFSIYPNPAEERFFIEMGKGGALEGTLRIQDLKGKVLLEERKVLENGRNRIESSGLADGVYMISFESQSGTFTKKLVIR